MRLEADHVRYWLWADDGQRRDWLSKFLIFLIFGFLFLSFREGLDRGYDRFIGSPGPFTYALSSVHTSEVHGIGRYAYIGPSLGDTASAFTKELGLEWSKSFREMSRGLDEKLEHVFSEPAGPLGAKVVDAPPYTDLYAVGWGMDLGYVDYVDFAFKIFGTKVSSLYHFYFLVLLVSLVVFCLSFSTRHIALFLAVAFSAAVYAFFSTNQEMFFDLYRLRTPTNPRFMSAFAIVPLLHAFFLLFYWRRLTVASVLALAIQAVILAFAIHGRTTANWALIGVVGLALSSILAGWLLKKWSHIHAGIAVGVVVLGANIVASTLASNATHPVMQYRGQLPQHTFWTSTYCALHHQWNWIEKLNDHHEGTICEDAARIGARKWGERNLSPQEFATFYNHEQHAFRSHVLLDALVKASYFDIAAEDPQYIFDTIVISNGARVYLMVTTANSFMLDVLFPDDNPRRLALGIVLLAALVLAGVRIGTDRGLWRDYEIVFPVFLILFVFSFAPNWIVLVLWDTLIDAYLLAFVAGCATIVFGVAALSRLATVAKGGAEPAETAGRAS